MALPKKVKNFNAFIDGVGYIGRVPEMTLPKLMRKMEEYRGAGMNGPVETDQGMEKMEGDITLAEYSRELLNQFGVTTVDGIPLRFRGAAISDAGDSSTDAIEIVMRGRFKEIDWGTSKPGDPTAMKLAYTLSYFKYTLNGEDLMEIDMLNLIETVGGVDRLAEQRDALGI